MSKSTDQPLGLAAHKFRTRTHPGLGYKGHHVTKDAQNAAIFDLKDFIQHQPKLTKSDAFQMPPLSEMMKQPGMKPRSIRNRLDSYVPSALSPIYSPPPAELQLLSNEEAANEVIKSLPDDFPALIWEFATIIQNEFPDLTITEVSMALFVFAYLQRTEKQQDYGTKEMESSTKQEFVHFMRFATAAYGKTILIDQGSVWQGSDQEWIQAHTKIPASDIYPYVDDKVVGDAAKRGESLLEHYVCVDIAKETVIVALKGTLTFLGALVDLDYAYEKATAWGEDTRYDVHGGMWKVAEALAVYPKLVGEVQTLLQTYPSYRLVVCGHSLGGGVAALLSVLWSQQQPDGTFVTSPKINGTSPSRPIKCFGFGPAASLDYDLAKRTRSMMASVVNKDDIVPSLSAGGIQDFNIIACELKGSSSITIPNLVMFPAARASCLKRLRELRDSHKNKKLVPPGDVWTIHAITYMSLEVRDIVKRFGEAKFLFGMLLDHAPTEYSQSLRGRMYGAPDFYFLLLRMVVGKA